jgi:hypothetical protein
MKMFIATAAIVALIASPALARTKQQRHVIPAPSPVGVLAADPVLESLHPGAVFWEGRYIGQDPDPQIRFDLRRQAPYYLDGGS